MAFTENERVLDFDAPQKPAPPVAPPASQPPAHAAPPPPAPDAAPTVAATTDRVLSYARAAWAECRPWADFYSTRRLSLPPFAALSDRFSANLHVYRPNYHVIAAFWLTVVLLAAIPNFLFAAFFFYLLGSWCARRARRSNNLLQPREKLFAVLAALLIFWLTDIGALAVTALLLSLVSIAVHATLHQPDTADTETATV